jgi:hypothetical protein
MFNGRRQPSRGGTSRMTRECQVRFCERLGVEFPGPTRRCRIFSGTTFLPHHEARMASGAAAMTASGETTRSLAAFCRAKSRNTSSPPAISISSDTQPIPLIGGWSHSSN